MSREWYLLTTNWQSFGHHRRRPNYLHVTVGVGVAVTIFLVYSSLRFMPNEPALVSIAIFNFLFIFLIFPLKGPLLRKVFLLLSGNIVGLAWYLVKSSFVAASAYYLEMEAFKAIYVVIGPIIDLIWIVSFWSLGLSFLASTRRRSEKERSGN